MADRFGYLTRFVLEKNGNTVWLHDPATGIFNRHYVMESTRYRTRIQETADNLFVDQDRGNRSPVEQRHLDQEIFVKKSSLTAIAAYVDALEEANGWYGTLHKSNALGTYSMNISAKMEHIEYLHPLRDAGREVVFKVTFFLFGKNWNG